MHVWLLAWQCTVAVAGLSSESEDLLAAKAATAAVADVETTYAQGTLGQKEAWAAASAAADAIKISDPSVPQRVLEKGKAKAADAYDKLVAKNEDRTTASEQAAEVVDAVVDAALPDDVDMDVLQAAEAASVVAAKAVDDYPNNKVLAQQDAKDTLRGVVTAESVAAMGAKEGVAEAEAKSDEVENVKAIAAAAAAVDTVESVEHLPHNVLTKAESQATDLYEGLVSERVPEQMAAKEAAQTVVSSLVGNGPELLKQAGEAAAQAAVEAIDHHPADPVLAEEEAASNAEKAVTADKIAAKAAVEAVTDVEDDSTLRVTKGVKQASASAAAAVTVIESEKKIAEGLAESAEYKAAEAFKKASEAKQSERMAAEQAANAAIEVIDAALSERLEASVREAATAASMAAAKAVGEHPGDEALALEEAGVDSANDLDIEKLRDATGVSDLKVGVSGGLSFWLFLPVLAVLGIIGYKYHKEATYVSPYMKEIMMVRNPTLQEATECGFANFNDYGLA